MMDTNHYSFAMSWRTLVFIGLFPVTLFAQNTPMPTSPFGVNRVVLSNGVFSFLYNGDTLYWYNVNFPDGHGFDQTGGDLHAIRAYTYDHQKSFLPSVAGGPRVQFSASPDIEKDAWDSVTFSRQPANPSAIQLVGDTVISTWKLTYGTSWCNFRYRIHISGRTLVIRVESLNGSRDSLMASGFIIERCENASNPVIVKIPYLTLFNLVACNNSFTSCFFDWEATNCSMYMPSSDSATERFSTSSVRYAPVALYYPKTNGKRNPLRETIYLTVSPDLNGALPNLPGPTAPKVADAMRKLVVSYGPPYPWLIDGYCPGPDGYCPYPYLYLDTLKHGQGIGSLHRVDSVAVILNNYTYYGRDRGIPDLFDASGTPDLYDGNNQGCDTYNNYGGGGIAKLQAVRHHVVDSLHYGFALYQNYVDYLRSSATYRNDPMMTLAARTAGASVAYVTNFTNCEETGYVIKPSQAGSVADHWSQLASSLYSPTWTYLDVQSAANPSWFVDYDTSVGPGAGKFISTMQMYRNLPTRFSGIGPVQGEGAYHFLYAGYFDDFEARLETADWRIYGAKAPLLVDFDLGKIRGRSALHGVSHYYSFFAFPTRNDFKWAINRDSMLTLVATEIAYGHAGLITKSLVYDNSIEQAIIENEHVLPVLQDVVNANVSSILYAHGNVSPSLTASQYVQTYPQYWDYTNNVHFMSRVKVTYDNGVVIGVNRSNSVWNIGSVGAASGWFAYNSSSLGVGTGGVATNDDFSLSAYNGWVVYDPLRPGGRVTGPSHINNNQNGTYTVTVSGGYPRYHYQWWIQYTGTGGLQVKTASTQGIVKPLLPQPGPTWYAIGGDTSRIVRTGLVNFALKCEVTDSRPFTSTSNIVYVTVGNGLAKEGEKPSSEQNLPTTYALAEAFPNPFNPSTTIKYDLPRDSYVILKVYDLLGRHVATLVNGQVKAGYQRVTFNAASIASGVYLYRIHAEGFTSTKKMLVIK